MNLSVEDFLKHNLSWDISLLTMCQRLGGLSNYNYKITYDDKEYFLRFSPHSYLHTDRALELEIINKTAHIGLCSAPIYYSLEAGNMVSPWLHGSIPSEEDFSSFNFINVLTKNLKNLHGLTCEGEFQLYKHIKERIALCKKYEIPLPDSIDSILKTLDNLEIKLDKNKHIGLCHNDLNCSNMILNKNDLYFIDYEYASMGDIFFDLATISWFMNTECRKYLIRSYFGHYKDEYYEKLLNYLFIVKLYNATWSLLKSRDSNGEYDYLKGATMLFDELLTFESIET